MTTHTGGEDTTWREAREKALRPLMESNYVGGYGVTVPDELPPTTKDAFWAGVECGYARAVELLQHAPKPPPTPAGETSLPKTFEELFDQSMKRPEYWKELYELEEDRAAQIETALAAARRQNLWLNQQLAKFTTNA